MERWKRACVIRKVGAQVIADLGSIPELRYAELRNKTCVVRNSGIRPATSGTLERGLCQTELWNETCVMRNDGIGPVSSGRSAPKLSQILVRDQNCVMRNLGTRPVTRGTLEPGLRHTEFSNEAYVIRIFGTRLMSCGFLEWGCHMWNAGSRPASCGTSIGTRPVSCGTLEPSQRHTELWNEAYFMQNFGMRPVSRRNRAWVINLKRRAQANFVDVLQYSTKKPQLGYEYLYYIKNHVQNVLVSHTYPLQTLPYKLVWDFKRALAHVVVI